MDSRVFVAGCKEYSLAEAQVRRIVDAFGGAKAIIGDKKRVLVKPNLVMGIKPDNAATTHPAVLEAVCRVFVEAGAEVQVIDSMILPHTVMQLSKIYKGTEIEPAVLAAGAELSFDTGSLKKSGANSKVVSEFELLAPVVNAEIVISIGKAKTHGLSHYTGCVKNLFGCIPGVIKPLFHQKYVRRGDFFSMMVDLCECVRPTFSFVDGVMGMEGPGPTGGTPKFLGIIAGGYNPYAVDLAVSDLMGLRADHIPIHLEAVQRGLVVPSSSELNQIGDAPSPFRTAFQPVDSENKENFMVKHLLPKKLRAALRNAKAKYPIISERCIGCGECARICPKTTIEMKNKRAVIKYDDCIRCYCCHEFCPAKAIDFGKKQ